MALTANVEQVIAVGRSQLGYTESPRGSNRTKYGQFYGLNGAPWCAIFVSWVFYHAGSPLKISTTKGFSYCPAVVDYAKRHGIWKTSNPKRGDLVLFSFGGRRADHVGIVQGVLPDGRIHTLEGNTNIRGSRTGGGVAEQYRRSKILGYVSIISSGSSAIRQPNQPVDWAGLRRMLGAQLSASMGDVPVPMGLNTKSLHVVVVQRTLNLVSGTKLKEDGHYGQATADAVAKFQKWMNALGAGITDFPGAIGNTTKWWLIVSLNKIRDGKA